MAANGDHRGLAHLDERLLLLAVAEDAVECTAQGELDVDGCPMASSKKVSTKTNYKI